MTWVVARSPLAQNAREHIKAMGQFAILTLVQQPERVATPMDHAQLQQKLIVMVSIKATEQSVTPTHALHLARAATAANAR